MPLFLIICSFSFAIICTHSGLLRPTFSLAKRNARSASVSVSPSAESMMNFSRSGVYLIVFSCNITKSYTKIISVRKVNVYDCYVFFDFNRKLCVRTYENNMLIEDISIQQPAFSKVQDISSQKNLDGNLRA